MPRNIAIDKDGNVILADANNNKIRKITPSGEVSTLAGSGIAGKNDGQGAAASFNYPSGVAIDKLGNIWVADSKNNSIRKITPLGAVSTFSGGKIGDLDGNPNSAAFQNPTGIAVDNAGVLYVTDQDNHKIRKISTTGVVSTLTGNGNIGYVDGNANVAMFDSPFGIIIDFAGNLIVSEKFRVRKITLGTITNIDEYSISNIKLYTIGKNIYVNNVTEATYYVFDINGILVYEGKDNEINLTGMPAGVYIVKILNETGITVKKVILQ